MENVKSPAFHFMSKRMVLPFAVGMLLCSTNASAADVNANITPVRDKNSS